jgi:hypothetical protein
MSPMVATSNSLSSAFDATYSTERLLV